MVSLFIFRFMDLYAVTEVFYVRPDCFPGGTQFTRRPLAASQTRLIILADHPDLQYYQIIDIILIIKKQFFVFFLFLKIIIQRLK